MPLFCNQRGQRLTRFGISYILTKYFHAAVIKCPSLANKRLHPHSAPHIRLEHSMKCLSDTGLAIVHKAFADFTSLIHLISETRALNRGLPVSLKLPCVESQNVGLRQLHQAEVCTLSGRGKS